MAGRQPDTSWSDPSSCRVPAAIPPAASEPAARGLSPQKVVAAPPQPLCLCDPEGTECGNGAGGHRAQRLGRGGVSGRGPSSCRSLVWSWSSGQREGLQAQGQAQAQVLRLALGSRRGCWGVAALESCSPPQALGALCLHPSPVMDQSGLLSTSVPGSLPSPLASWVPVRLQPKAQPPPTVGSSLAHLPPGDPVANTAQELPRAGSLSAEASPPGCPLPEANVTDSQDPPPLPHGATACSPPQWRGPEGQ